MFIVEADGGSRGNPGPAGYGAVVKSFDGRVLAEAAESIGTATNNVAEYRGLIAGLQAVLTLGGEGQAVEVRMDSKLVIEQMAGRWKVKNEGLRPLALEAAAMARRVRPTWKWIPRERNAHADRLANEAMDAAAKGEKWRATSIVEPPASATAPRQETAHATPDGDVSSATDVRRAPGWMPPPVRVPTSLLLLRHGETPLSVEKRFSGLGDPALTPNGLAQAEAAAVRLSREPYHVDVVVSSPLTRARQTAEKVGAWTGAPVRIDEDLRETDFGHWEGHAFAEIQQKWPAELASWLADPGVAPPGGESFATTAMRVARARDRIVREHEGKTVLVVSHVTPIKILVRLALEAPPEALYRMHLDLACLSIIDYYADGPAVVRSLNDTAHLR
jgi:broad specificity phosphatase PhoE/ribonuclease HI